MIQSPADALLGLMFLKQQGQLPHDFRLDVQPIIDVEKYYLRAQATIEEVQTAGALAAGTVGFVTVPGMTAVPAGHVRWVQRATIQIAVEAGVNVKAAAAYMDIAGPSVRDVIVGQPSSVTASAGVAGVCIPASLENFWVGEGMHPCFAIENNGNAAAVAVAGFHRYIDIPR